MTNARQLEVCKLIHAKTADLQICLQPEWVQRSENTVANRMSKHYDESQLSAQSRTRIVKHFGEGLPIVVPGFSDASRAMLAASRKHTSFIVVVPSWPLGSLVGQF